MNIIKQFDIFLVNLNPTEGSEQNGIRPCVCLQTNAVSDFGRTTLIAPLTSKKVEKVYPFEFLIKPSKKNKIKELSKINLSQIKVIDKSRIIKKIGLLEDEYFEGFKVALQNIFDLNSDFRK
jgi:mRNA interferase MazF